MGKWLDDFNKSNQNKIEKRIEKLKQEYDEYRRNYNDFPYERYYKAMQKREEEIEELERFGSPLNAKREVEDYKEEIERLNGFIGKIHYLSVNIEPCDQKSDANLKKLQSITAQYTCDDNDFKIHADMGVW